MALIAAQFALPPLAARKAEHRLTADGGTADVKLGALPSVRLLFGEGDSARVRARGVTLPLITGSEPVLAQLDGFDDVDMRATDAQAGPFRLAAVTLERRGEAPYRTHIEGSVTARELATFGAAAVGGPIAGLLGDLGGGILPFGDRPVPLDLTAVITSDAGRPRALSVQGQVAGVPAGPLAEALAQALAGRF